MKESIRNNQIYIYCRKQSAQERKLHLLFKNARSMPNMWEWIPEG